MERRLSGSGARCRWLARLSTALLLGLCAGLWPAAEALAQQRFQAFVTHVSDGDTLWVRTVLADDHPPGPARQAHGGAGAKSAGRRPPAQRLKLRIFGIDAPESCQPHGPEAAAALKALALGRRIEVRRRAIDDHGRTIATLWLGGQDLGAAMVTEGHAWSAGYRGKPGPYASQEALARGYGRGLFAAPAPEPPRGFRRRHGPCS